MTSMGARTGLNAPSLARWRRGYGKGAKQESRADFRSCADPRADLVSRAGLLRGPLARVFFTKRGNRRQGERLMVRLRLNEAAAAERFRVARSIPRRQERQQQPRRRPRWQSSARSTMRTAPHDLALFGEPPLVLRASPQVRPRRHDDAGNDGGHEKLEMATRARAACRNSSRRRTRQETMASIVCAGHNLHARFGSHWLVRSQQ